MIAAAICWLMATHHVPGCAQGVGVEGNRSAAAGNAPAGLQVDDSVRLLNQQLQQLREDNQRQQLELIQANRQLAASEGANRWLPWLVLGMLASVGVAVLQLLRVRRLQRELDDAQGWAEQAALQRSATAADEKLSSPGVLLSTDQPLLSRSGVNLVTSPAPGLTMAQPKVEAPTLAALMESSASMPARRGPQTSDFSMGTGVQPRAVSVEELLDLDQQVDFFLVLGQEQSAIDLLLAHVRSTGGASAQPYFRLLDIFRQQGDEEAYERTRERFNQRFNAFAPDWSGDLSHGLSLDSYPEVIQRLQIIWSEPELALITMSELLARRADLEPFDLPAYRDLLLLHSIAADLLEQGRPAIESVPQIFVQADDESATVELAGLPRARAESDVRSAELPAEGTLAKPKLESVDLLLPLDDSPGQVQPDPSKARLSERSNAQAMLAEWVYARSTSQLAKELPRNTTAASGESTIATMPRVGRMKLDIDLNELTPAPREFTRPAAFTDIDMRRDSHPSDLAAFDDSDLLPPGTRSS
jgi:hypothetical protein